jgi:hypothetical protein
MNFRSTLQTAAIVLAVTGGCAVGAGRSMAGSAPAAPPRCANYQTLVTPVSGNGATGHISEMFRIHDTLPGSCQLFGYPGAELLDRSFHSLPTHVTRAPWPEGGPGPRTVTLSSGHDAYFVLAWVHIPTPGQRCPTASYVMITPPNDRLPDVTYAGTRNGPSGIDACGGNLTVSPVAGTRFWS